MAKRFKLPTYEVDTVHARFTSGTPDVAPGYLTSSVGDGVGSKPADIYRVQYMLNVAAAPGIITGEALPLVLDGAFGKNTRARLVDYQENRFGTADALVEPSGPTIRALLLDSQSLTQSVTPPPLPDISKDRIMAGGGGAKSGPLGYADQLALQFDSAKRIIPRQSDVSRIYSVFSTMPNITRMADAALKVLDEARRDMQTPEAALVRKHFTHKSNSGISQGMIDFISYFISELRQESVRRSGIRDGGIRSVAIGHYPGQPTFTVENTIALTQSGRRHVSDFRSLFISGFTRDIWFGPAIDYVGYAHVSRVLFHELSHYVGGPVEDDNTHIGDVEGRGPTFLPSYTSLTQYERMRNADTYAAFAAEANHGTDVLKAWRSNPNGEFDREPFVENGGVLRGGKIIRKK